MKKQLLLVWVLAAAATCAVQGQTLQRAKVGGPWPVRAAILTDTVGMNGAKYNPSDLLRQSYDVTGKSLREITADKAGRFVGQRSGTGKASTSEMTVYTFSLTAERFAKGDIEVYGQGRMSLWQDNKQIGISEGTNAKGDSTVRFTAPLTLVPGTHEFVLKSLLLEGDSTLTDVRLVLKPKTARDSTVLYPNYTGKRRLTLDYMMNGTFIGGGSLSPSGKYVVTSYRVGRDNKAAVTYSQLRDAKGRVLTDINDRDVIGWMPHEDLLMAIRKEGNVKRLIAFDPMGQSERTLIADMPETSFRMSPDGKYFIFMKEEKGPGKDALFVRNIDPDDRQNGWRNRAQLFLLNAENGVYSPLTFGYSNTYIYDIAPDSKRVLLGTLSTDWTKSPYRFVTVTEYHLETGKIDTLVVRDPSIDQLQYTPDGKRLVVTAAADAFGGAGVNLPTGMTVNGYDKQFFLFDITTRKVTPLTKNFDPSVQPGRFDNKNGYYYFIAEKGARKALYRLNLSSQEIREIQTGEDVVRWFAVAADNGALWYAGQSANNADRLYRLDGNRGQLVWDLSAEKLANIDFTPARDWNYTAPDGTVVEGWYYLPPQFDPMKKYPMLVYYYGGTSPTSRTLEGHYSLAMYAAQGYVVYTLNPSGSTGYGQEYAARHVNAWGDRTADEIIGATKEFVRQHNFVDGKKIGCFGASYGGFMTQYLQTKTDIFAAAVSHAGISSISNYWGSGYWGMGYSTVASAGSYPWNNPELYANHSPLFRADKIHTPLLLLHGSVDTNVPKAESVNLYNALKILGREVEFIEFTEQDHFILEPERRIRWTNSIFAWFARWLQDDPTWWNELYPPTNL
ncbi:S9 family peptidase [Porphyromonas loveana]|uniref:S9 family peptidase n=2 Tax=Porphyromonas loveana TaxID=1884669 RepID=UPI0035A108E5